MLDVFVGFVAPITGNLFLELIFKGANAEWFRLETLEATCRLPVYQILEVSVFFLRFFGWNSVFLLAQSPICFPVPFMQHSRRSRRGGAILLGTQFAPNLPFNPGPKTWLRLHHREMFWNDSRAIQIRGYDMIIYDPPWVRYDLVVISHPKKSHGKWKFIKVVDLKNPPKPQRKNSHYLWKIRNHFPHPPHPKPEVSKLICFFQKGGGSLLWVCGSL